MALGILEPPVEHVQGTVYVHEYEQRHAELLETARHLKRDKTGRVILVPQPSNDPNDPLVSCFLNTLLHSPLITIIELASLEARCDSWCPLLRLMPCYNCITSTRSRFGDTCDPLQANFPGCGPSDSLPSCRCRRGRMAVCGISKSLGQETSVSLWSAPYGRKFCLGWINT